MMRDCTEFHSKCGPLGPFLHRRHLGVTRWRSMTRAGTSCLDWYPNPIEALDAANVTNLSLFAAW